MAEPTKVKTAAWGSVSAIDGKIDGLPSGVVTSFEATPRLITAQEQNEVGAVIQVLAYDNELSMSATIQVTKETELPTLGTAITFDLDYKGYVTECALTESNQGWRSIRVTAIGYQHCAAINDERGSDGNVF